MGSETGVICRADVKREVFITDQARSRRELEQAEIQVLEDQLEES